jgi:hypothetical protein
MPPPSFLIPKPPALLRVSESQAISNSSSFISSASSSSLFDRISSASSGYLTDVSSPLTPSSAEFGNREEKGVTQPSDSPIEEQVGRDRELLPSQSRLPQPTKVSLSTRLDRACALGSRSSARSYSQNGTSFVSLIPVPVPKNDNRRYLPALDSEDTFDPITILRNRIERGNQTIATRRALEFMESGGRPGQNKSVGGAVDAPLKVVVSGPDSPVEDWSNDFELGSSSDLNISVLFPSASDCSLLDEVEHSVSSPILPKFSVKLPSTPVLDPVTPISPCSPFTLLSKFSVKFPSTPVLYPISPVSPCSPFTLGTPALSTNWENSRSSISTLMAESPLSSPIPSPVNISFDEEEMARIMHTVLSRTRHPLSGSPEGVDVTTVMRVEIASTLAAGRTGTLVGLGVAMPVIYPPLPPTLFPLHHPPGTALNSRRVFSLRNLGYQSYDDRMFGIEQTSSALLSRNVHEPSEARGLGFEINESLLYSPLQGCTAPTPLLPVDFDCSDAFQVEQTLSQAHTTINHTSTIAFGKALVGLGLGLGVLTEASVESQPLPDEPFPTNGMQKIFSIFEKCN